MNTQPKQRKSFIAKFWKGHVALPAAFWIVGGMLMLLPLLMPPLMDLLAGWGGSDPRAVLIDLGCLTAIGLLVLIWWAIGLWRSAGYARQAAKRAGKWTLWSHLSRFVVILGCAGLLPALLYRAAPMGLELYKIVALGDPDIPNYRIQVLASGSQVEISGGIKHGLADELAAVLDQNPAVRILHLSSGGGRVGEAQLLSDLVRHRRLDTFVRYSCTSACTSVFLAGGERIIETSARLGFHAASFPGMTIQDRRRSGQEWSSHLLLAGVAPTFISKAIEVPSAQMWYPDADELLAANVVTLVVPDGRMPASLISAGLLQRANEIGAARSLLVGLEGADLVDALTAFQMERDQLLIAIQALIEDSQANKIEMAKLDPLIRNITRRHAQRLPALDDTGIAIVLEHYRKAFRGLDALSPQACRAFLGDYGALADLPDLASVLEDLLAVAGPVVRASAALPKAGAPIPLISEIDWDRFLQSAARAGVNNASVETLRDGTLQNCDQYSAIIDAAIAMSGGAGSRVRGHLLRLLASK